MCIQPQRAKTSAYRILGKFLSTQPRFITLQPCRINIGEIDIQVAVEF